MSKKAIVLPYVCYQNEPSVPSRHLVTVPDDEERRDVFLHELFTTFYEIDDEELLEDVKVDTAPNTYGDVGIGDGDMFLYLTFVDEEIEVNNRTDKDKWLERVNAEDNGNSVSISEDGKIQVKNWRDEPEPEGEGRISWIKRLWRWLTSIF